MVRADFPTPPPPVMGGEKQIMRKNFDEWVMHFMMCNRGQNKGDEASPAKSRLQREMERFARHVPTITSLYSVILDVLRVRRGFEKVVREVLARELER